MENRGKNIMSSTNEGFEKTLFKIESLGGKNHNFLPYFTFTLCFVVFNVDICFNTKMPSDGMFK